MRTALLILLAIFSVFKIDILYTGEPEWFLWGNPDYIHYDPVEHAWINDNPARENLFRAMDHHDRTNRHSLPERVPERKRLGIKLHLQFWRREDSSDAVRAAMFCGLLGTRSSGTPKKILLLNGPSQDPSDRFYGWPTPLLYAVAPTIHAIRTGQLELEVTDKMFDPWSYTEGVNSEEIKVRFRNQLHGVDIICASATYDAIYPTLQLFAEAKRLNPGIVTVLGGPHCDETHASPEHNEIIGSSDLIDYLIAGDGEFVLLELLGELSSKAKADIAAVAGRSAGHAWVYDNQGRSAFVHQPLCLDDLPFMPIDLADEQHRFDFDIFSDESGTMPTAQMIAARGCPYGCSFCSERKELAPPNARSIKNILKELELRKRQGFQAVFFDDSTFGAYPKLRELLRELGKTGMKFGCLNRFHLLSKPEMVEMFRDAGFVYFYCAIEQYEDHALKSMAKGQTARQIRMGMRNLEQIGMKIGVSLLYGFPYETADSIRATLDFTEEWVHRGVIALVSESILSYHPGTPEGQMRNLNFNRTPPHVGYPWNRFEEGQWFHPEHVTVDYLENILTESERRFSNALVRHRHSWAQRFA